MKKRFVLLLLCLVLLFGLNGCSVNGNSKQSRAIKYLEERYPDDEFELVSSFGGGMGTSGHTFVFTSKKYPNAKVHVLSNGDTFKDSYLSIKYGEESRKLVDEILTRVIGEDHIVGVSTDTVLCDESPDISFEEYKDSMYMDFSCVTSYSLDEKDRDEFAERLKNEFMNEGIKVSMSKIYFDKGTEGFADAKKYKSLRNYNGLKYADFYCVFDVTKKEEDFYIRWDEND